MAGSSRSHLIISILIETKNRATGKVAVGKLSLVDLAGSERAGKTGAVCHRPSSSPPPCPGDPSLCVCVCVCVCACLRVRVKIMGLLIIKN
jgi:hypothetical protein